MADKDPHEIVIIRRRVAHEEGRHGGAWKIAFADFMTAMMALFLVLWLISTTSDKTKRAVAQYFNPVKLVDMTTLKKGFEDPKETEMGAGPSVKETTTDKPRNQSQLWMKDANSETAAKMPTHSETALFRDPYAVLAEIVRDARAEVPKVDSEAAQTPMGAPADLAEAFKDPFTTVPRQPEPKTESARASERGKAATAPDEQDSRAASEGGEPAAAAQPPEPAPKLHGRAARSIGERPGAVGPQANDAETAKLKSAIFNAVRPDAQDGKLPRIEVQATDEGVLISLTDDLKYMMFAIGSSEPLPKTIEVVEKIGRLLQTRAGAIIIRGYTDGRLYKSGAYDNWRLSAARAHMAHYMLARGGLDEKRIERIEGYADRKLKIPSDPTAAANRRIEILLKKEKP